MPPYTRTQKHWANSLTDDPVSPVFPRLFVPWNSKSRYPLAGLLRAYSTQERAKAPTSPPSFFLFLRAQHIPGEGGKQERGKVGMRDRVREREEGHLQVPPQRKVKRLTLSRILVFSEPLRCSLS